MLSKLSVSASVVFGVFLAIGAVLFSLVRAYGPPFLFFSIFGTISLDIFCVCRFLHLFGCSYDILPPGYRSSIPFCKLQNHQQFAYRRVKLLRHRACLLFCSLSPDREPRIHWPDICNS